VTDFQCLEPAIDPSNRVSFLLDWELTMKCNLDCDYCSKGLYGGHDNSTQHPPLDQCVAALEFMYQYADLYMQSKPEGIRHVILNVYGGESLHHPHIVSILTRAHKLYQQHYKHKWYLTVTTTTNAIVTKKKLQRIIPLIDEFTVSYHTNNTAKQKTLFKSNILDILAAGKRLKCVVLMHVEPDLFKDAQNMIAWCEQYKVKFLPRQLDQLKQDYGQEATFYPPELFKYDSQQVVWFEKLYQDKTYKFNPSKILPVMNVGDKINLTLMGRACCGGRSLCKDQSYKSRDFYVQNNFFDWFCSVNEFFVYIKQVTGEIFTNKDCKMNFDGAIGPIGNLNNTHELLEQLKSQMLQKILPTIQCKKTQCLCGLCAPKAKNQQDFDHIMVKYRS